MKNEKSFITSGPGVSYSKCYRIVSTGTHVISIQSNGLPH